MGAGEEGVITVRLDLQERYKTIMDETQMDSNELMEHFFLLYNSNVEKVWTESEDSKQAKHEGLQKATEYWMEKIMHKPDHAKLFPKSQQDEGDAEENTYTQLQSAGTGDEQDEVREIETIPALQQKRKHSRKIILTLPDNILSKDISVNVCNKMGLGLGVRKFSKGIKSRMKKKQTRNTTALTTDLPEETNVPSSIADKDMDTEECNPHKVSSEPESDLREDKNKEMDENNVQTEITDTPLEQEESSLETEEYKPSTEPRNVQTDEEDAVVEDSNSNVISGNSGLDEEYEEQECLEMSVDEILDHTKERQESEDTKFVRDVALSIAKDMAVTENGETIFNCNFCSYKTSVLGRLRRHITVHTGKEFKCPFCSKAYTEKCKLTEHIKVKHEKSVSYPCPKCSKVFTSKRGLEYHNTTFHEERGTTLKCSFCPKFFSSRFGFTYHTKTAHGEAKVEENFKSTSDTLIPMSKWTKSTYKKPDEKEFKKNTDGMYSCKLCDYKTPRMFHIRRHLSVHYGNTNKCEQCDKTFSDAYKLRLHVQVKHGSLRFECDYCHRDFGTKEGLKYHRLSAHEGNWKFLCPDCGQGFYQKHHFEGHVNKHKGIRAYGCKTCGKKFFYRSDVSIHKKHCGQERKPLEKPTTFVCHVCGDQFKKKSVLTEHVNGKHGVEGNYNCECGVSFKWRNSLRQHKQRCPAAAAISDCSASDITDLSGASDFIAMQIKSDLDPNSMDYEDNSHEQPPKSTNPMEPVDNPEKCLAQGNKDPSPVVLVKKEPRDNEEQDHGAMLIPPGVSEDTAYQIPAVQVSDQDGNGSDILIYLDDSSSSSSSCGEPAWNTSDSDEEYLSVKSSEHHLNHTKRHSNSYAKLKRCWQCGKQFRKRKALLKHKSFCHRRAIRRQNIIEMYVCGFCEGRFSNKEHFKEHSKTHTRKMMKRFGFQHRVKKNSQSCAVLRKGRMKCPKPIEQVGSKNETEDNSTQEIVPEKLNDTLLTSYNDQQETPVVAHEPNMNNNHAEDIEHPQTGAAYGEENEFNYRPVMSPFETPKETKNDVSDHNDVRESIQDQDYGFRNQHVTVVDLSNAQEYSTKNFDSGWDLSIKQNQLEQNVEKVSEWLMHAPSGEKKTNSSISASSERGPLNLEENNFSSGNFESEGAKGFSCQKSGNIRSNSVVFQTSFTCEICGAIIDDHENYINHISLHASSRIQMYQEQQSSSHNDSIPNEFESRSTCEVQASAVDRNNGIVCTICGEHFLKRSYLKEHMRGMHGDPNRYSCSCGEHFKWRSSLYLHKEKCASCKNVPHNQASIKQKQNDHLQSFPSHIAPANHTQNDTEVTKIDQSGRKHKSPTSKVSSSQQPISSVLPPLILPGMSPRLMNVMSPPFFGVRTPLSNQQKQYMPKVETHMKSGDMYIHSTENTDKEHSVLNEYPVRSRDRNSSISFDNRDEQKSTENVQYTQSVVPTGIYRNDCPTDYSFPQQGTQNNIFPVQKSCNTDSNLDPDVNKGHEKAIINGKNIKQEAVSFDDEPDEKMDATADMINEIVLATESSDFLEGTKNEPPRASTRLDQSSDTTSALFRCSICKKHFRTRVAYTDHMNKHKGIKPYSCSYCRASFHYQSLLSSHMKSCGIGENTNPLHKCHICGDTFTVRSYLREHVLGKHGDARRYSCMCGATFKWRSSLGGHQKKCPFAVKS